MIGWCNANDRGNYTKLNLEARPDLWVDYQNEKVKSIICITIAPLYRRRGLSKVILESVIADTSNEGYDYLEAYPGTGKPDGRSYHGSSSIYEKSGFTRLESNPDTVRLKLR